MSSIDYNNIIFDLKKSGFKELYNYKNKSLHALWTLLYNRNITIKKRMNASVWCGQQQRPYMCNDRYNKIILSLLHNCNVGNESHEVFKTHPETYTMFLTHRLDIPLRDRETIEEIVSDFIKASEPTKYNLSYKKPKYNEKVSRKIEKALGQYLINKFIEIRDYYYIKKAESVKNEKAAQREYNSKPFKCICGYEGLIKHKSRHIKTTLCEKRTRILLFDELPFII